MIGLLNKLFKSNLKNLFYELISKLSSSVRFPDTNTHMVSVIVALYRALVCNMYLRQFMLSDVIVVCTGFLPCPSQFVKGSFTKPVHHMVEEGTSALRRVGTSLAGNVLDRTMFAMYL